MFKGRSTVKKFITYGVICLSLIVADYQFQQMQQIRAWMSLAVTPVQWLVDVPQRSWTWLDERLQARDELIAENKQLRAQALLAERRVQKLASLTVENFRLRDLLNSGERLDEKVMVSELIGTNSDPFVHQIIINNGFDSNVFVGQPVLDATGVMGQVTSTSAFTSRVLLITDADHAIPVQVNRNGLRSVAYGRGHYDYLELEDLADTADIEVGDILVSSGLGLRFPKGYPVAEVIEVQHLAGQDFAKILAKPTAQLSRSRHLLLIETAHQQTAAVNRGE
ncbi:MAG: rod shape-determining protein MreC [Oceanospirillaceae bacterium]|nr:rod shape-determining protein MreC [Oceanospirillaceae bacterium]MBT4441927.1 rod shape-determining protein MreC [Oceanospirillaceae bacterium]MBT6076476.1 rod shape-determining protein MreC [Oceanospirillaceae bacterium]MBT7331502.1 rod shape-determining protein MreC [Oceanospirillaceae bacterium]